MITRVKHTAIQDELECARLALQDATSLQEVKAIWDKSEAGRLAAKRAGLDKQALSFFMEIRLRAERRGGELLGEMGRARGRPASQAQAATLSSLGITRNQSSGWKRLAAIPQLVFESYLTESRERGDVLSVRKIVSLADELRGSKRAKRARSTTSLRKLAATVVSPSPAPARDLQELKDHLDNVTRVLQGGAAHPQREMPPANVRYACQLVREMRSVVGRIERGPH